MSILLVLTFYFSAVRADDVHLVEPHKAADTALQAKDEASLATHCQNWLTKLPGSVNEKEIATICSRVLRMSSCTSTEGLPIFHYEKIKKEEKKNRRILVFGLMHGDEFESGTVARSWMTRLERIDPRNSWRVVPVLNPDGFVNKRRVNARGVDINRNFPTQDWDKNALAYWKAQTKSDSRRFPGDHSASEKETQCAIDQINEFQPDFIISVHTPYGVLDFDGPKKEGFPKFDGLPWASLGTYPGSLGRYMWTDRKKPVLTIELKSRQTKSLDYFDKLQDLSGDLVLKVSQTE